jgi:hypothetical protein
MIFLDASVDTKQACCGTQHKDAGGIFMSQTVLAPKGASFVQHLFRKNQRQRSI